MIEFTQSVTSVGLLVPLIELHSGDIVVGEVVGIVEVVVPYIWH